MSKFKISPNWGCTVDLQSMIDDAKFAFITKGNHQRPCIVTNNSYNSINCFEISYDNSGLVVSSTRYIADYKLIVTDVSKNVVGLISKFLIKSDASEFILDSGCGLQLNQIDVSTTEGKLLIQAIAKITTESQTEKTPFEVLHQIVDLQRKVDQSNRVKGEQVDERLSNAMGQIIFGDPEPEPEPEPEPDQLNTYEPPSLMEIAIQHGAIESDLVLNSIAENASIIPSRSYSFNNKERRILKEIVICTSISGHHEHKKGLPKQLELVRISDNGEQAPCKYVDWGVMERLWSILDDIDSLSDRIKPNDLNTFQQYMQSVTDYSKKRFLLVEPNEGGNFLKLVK